MIAKFPATELNVRKGIFCQARKNFNPREFNSRSPDSQCVNKGKS